MLRIDSRDGVSFRNQRRIRYANLKGKVAVVTGCGKGIGEAIVKKFLEEEIDGVAMLEYDEDLCRETAARLDPTGQRAVPIRCDVSDGAQVQ